MKIAKFNKYKAQKIETKDFRVKKEWLLEKYADFSFRTIYKERSKNKPNSNPLCFWYRKLIYEKNENFLKFF